MSNKNTGLASAEEEETKERIARKGGEAAHGEQNISAEFPFESNYVEVLGSKMHYIDEGEGDPSYSFMATQLPHIYGEISSHM